MEKPYVGSQSANEAVRAKSMQAACDLSDHPLRSTRGWQIGCTYRRPTGTAPLSC